MDCTYPIKLYGTARRPECPVFRLLKKKGEKPNPKKGVFINSPDRRTDVMFVIHAPNNSGGPIYDGEAWETERKCIEVSGVAVFFTCFYKCGLTFMTTHGVFNDPDRPGMYCQEALLQELREHKPLVVALIGSLPIFTLIGKSFSPLDRDMRRYWLRYPFTAFTYLEPNTSLTRRQFKAKWQQMMAYLESLP